MPSVPGDIWNNIGQKQRTDGQIFFYYFIPSVFLYFSISFFFFRYGNWIRLTVIELSFAKFFYYIYGEIFGGKIHRGDKKFVPTKLLIKKLRKNQKVDKWRIFSFLVFLFSFTIWKTLKSLLHLSINFSFIYKLLSRKLIFFFPSRWHQTLKNDWTISKVN